MKYCFFKIIFFIWILREDATLGIYRVVALFGLGGTSMHIPSFQFYATPSLFAN